jgi:site-specific recombinase XerC
VLSAFEGQVQRGARSPSTLDEYRYLVKRVIQPGIELPRLGEFTTPRLDRFVQAVLKDRGYATAKLTRSVLSGICGWLVRQGAIASNPVRDLTPLEQNRDHTARALSADKVVTWLALLNSDDLARRLDLPELARFMLATGLRLGEALGVTWADLDLVAGSVTVQRTIIRVQGQGLVAKRVKSRASERRLLLPSWCVDLLEARRVGSALSTVRYSQTRRAVGATGATSARPSGGCGTGPTSSGLRPTPSARRWRLCWTAAAPAPE